MKQIFFIRHAKSSWADHSLDDIDRPLNKRGVKDAPFMATQLVGEIAHVDLIISSPARRAQDTCAHFEEKITRTVKQILPEVYHAWPENLIEVVRNIDPQVNSALIFGHNPGFTSVFNHFSKNNLDNLPTCGIFELKCQCEWSEVDTSNTETGLLLYPKMYRR